MKNKKLIQQISFSLNKTFLLKFLLKNHKINYSFITKNINNKKKIINKINKIFDEKLSEEEIYKANKYILLHTGIKKYNYLVCTEIGHFKEGKTIFDFDTFYDWDKDWWKFQESFLQKESSSKNTYSELFMRGEWFRWIEKNEFGYKKSLIYGSLIGLFGYVSDEIFNYLEELIDKKYPNMLYKPYLEDTFKKSEDSKYYTMYNFQTRAADKEDELKLINELKKSSFKEIEKIISQAVLPYTNYTFFQYQYLPEHNTNIKNHLKIMIFGGLDVAKKIRIKHFLEDFYSFEQPLGVVDNLIENLKIIIKQEFFDKWVKIVEI